jgi:hypothetical protein
MQKLIFSKIAQMSSFNFGDVLSQSIDLFKKVWVEGFVHLLLIFVVTIPAIVIMYISVIALFGLDYILVTGVPGAISGDEFSFAMLPALLGGFLLTVFVAAVMQTFSIAIMAHFYKVCKNADMGTNTDTGGYFSFLMNGNFKKVLALSFTMMGVTLLAALLCYFPLFYVIVPMSLVLVIFAFNPELSVTELIRAAFKMGNKIWLATFGMIILAGIIAQLGVIACGIGVFFTAIFSRIPVYYIYKSTIGFDEVLQETPETF